MPYEADDCFKRQDELAAARALEEPRWRDLAMLHRPDDGDFEPRNTADADDTELYTSVTLEVVETFVGGMFGQGINPATSWCALGLDDDDLSKFRPVAEVLKARTDRLYRSMAPAVSSFYAEMPAVFAGLGVFGNGYLSQEEIVGEGGISDRQRPLGECFIDVDTYGRLHTFHRQWATKGFKAKQRFPGLQMPDDQTAVFLHCLKPNPDFQPGAFGARGKRWASTYCSTDVKNFRQDGGFYELPYHVFQWNRSNKRAYAKGPGAISRPNALTHNESERSALVAEQFMAEPPILTSDEAAFTAADITPNSVLEGAWKNGKPNMGHLERDQKMEFSVSRGQRREDAIRAAWMFSIMQIAQQRPQMTATEFLGYQEQFLQLMAPNLVRIQTGGLSSFIARRYAIMDRAHAFDDIPWPPEARGRLTIKFVSPLDKLQKVQQARGAIQYATAMSQIAQAKADPTVMDNVNGDAYAPILQDAFTDQVSVRTDPKDVAQIRAQRSAAQQQQAQLEQAGQAAEIAATVGHAQQAATLAKQRVAK